MTRHDRMPLGLLPVVGRGKVPPIGIIAALIALLLAASASAPASSLASANTSSAQRPASQVLWTGDMEEGSLADWELDDEGGEFNSGSADTVASSDVVRSGQWSAQLTATTPPESGTRLFRWGEARRNRDLYYEAWFYLPVSYQLTADPNTGRYWNIFQFKSTNQDGSQNDPIWFLNAINGPDGSLVPQVGWSPQSLEGPRAGELGSQGFLAEDVTLPVGRWFQIRARLRQSKDFDGLVRFWVDGQKIFDMRDVRTGHSNCDYNDWCVDQGWSVNNYSDGLSPSPATIHVDDARIRRPAPRCWGKPPSAATEA